MLVLSAPSTDNVVVGPPEVSVNTTNTDSNEETEEGIKFVCPPSQPPPVCMVAEMKFKEAETVEEKKLILIKFETKIDVVKVDTKADSKDKGIIPDDSENDDNCDKLQWDIALIDIALMFFLPLAACFFPYYSKLPMFSCLNVDAYVSWINCMGAGILLGTSFFHLLPEISNEVDMHLKKMYQLEQDELVEKARIQEYKKQKNATLEASAGRSRRHAHSHDDHGHSHGPGGHDDLTFEIYVIVGFFIILISEQFVMTYLMGYFSDMEAKPEQKPEEEALHQGHNHGHGHSHEIEGEASTSTIRAIGFVASLAVHCVVEGAALTLRTESWQANTVMLASIIFHKIPVGMTMGFLMESSNLKPKTAKIACVDKKIVKKVVVFHYFPSLFFLFMLNCLCGHYFHQLEVF